MGFVVDWFWTLIGAGAAGLVGALIVNWIIINQWHELLRHRPDHRVEVEPPRHSTGRVVRNKARIKSRVYNETSSRLETKPRVYNGSSDG